MNNFEMTFLFSYSTATEIQNIQVSTKTDNLPKDKQQYLTAQFLGPFYLMPNFTSSNAMSKVLMKKLFSVPHSSVLGPILLNAF
jgi:hypothetical protein